MFQEMERTAIVGIAIGVSMAFPILCISTMNWIVGSLATLYICCTTICVIGVIPLAGWKLGVCLIILLLFVHLVHFL